MDYNEKDYPLYRIDDIIDALRDAEGLGYKFCQLIEFFDEKDKIHVLSIEAISCDKKSDGSDLLLFSTEIEQIEEVNQGELNKLNQDSFPL